MLQHRAGFTHRHLAGQQRRHFLHPRRVARTFLQTQHRVGGKTPLAATLAISSAPPNRNGPKLALEAPLVAVADLAQGLLTYRTYRWRDIGFLLSRLLRGRAQ